MTRPTLTAVLSIVALACTALAGSPARYCNPLPIPDYPVGRLVRDITVGAPSDGGLWLVPQMEQYRELADPSALWHEGTWYLYPSCDMAWVSHDEGRSWEHHPLNVRDLGYAPTIVKHKNRFLLMASGSDIYEAPSPLGPFQSLGPLGLPKDKGLPPLIDPMLFSDDDGRLFFYWGCTPDRGIWGVELDAANPTRLIGEPKELIPFEPEAVSWQRLGNNNQNHKTGWMEGAWMLKEKGRYYLTFSAGGTQYQTYTMGCAVGESPLGPFKPQPRNPILRTTDGLVTGTAHGCVARGPGGALWGFYTVYACASHGFERRIGMDRAHIDTEGNLLFPRATSTPQRIDASDTSGDWIPLNELEPTLGSSSAPNAPGRFAVDHSLTTWWLPAPNDAAPALTSEFSGPAEVRATRVIWRDVGLDTKSGANPGPFRYKIEVQVSSDSWQTVVDQSRNSTDLLIDYQECRPVVGTRARLVILGAPSGITPAVAEFTVFGRQP